MQSDRPHADGRRACGATKRDGTLCPTPPMANGRCRMHGGASLAGLASPSFRHGRHSRYLPARLLERYQAAEADPTLLNLHAEIAVLDARLGDVLTRVDTGESGHLWAQVRAVWSATQSADAGIALAAKFQMMQLIDEGIADYEAWAEVQTLIQQRRLLVESERRHVVEAQQMIRVDQVLILVTTLLASVKTHVTDPAAFTAIAADFARLSAGRAGDPG